MMKQPGVAGLQFADRHVVLVVFPILAFAAGELVIGLLGPTPALTVTLTPPPAVLREAGNRVGLLALMLLFFAFSLVVIGKTCHDIWTAFEGASFGRLLRIAIFCLVGGGALVGAALAGQLPRNMDLLGWELFRQAFEVAQSYSVGQRWSFDAFDRALAATNAISVLAVSAVVTAGFSCLGSDVKPRAVENWKRQSARLRGYVYLSAAYMIVGVLFLKAWAQYPSFMLRTDAEAAAYAAHVSAMTTYAEVELSLVLAGFAMPVAVLLSGDADRIARKLAADASKTAIYAVSPGDIAAVRKREELTIPTQDVLKSLVAIVAPFITGSVASLTSLAI